MITTAKIWYGDRDVRLESDGVCALEIFFTGNPVCTVNRKFNYKLGSRKLLLWADYQETYTNETLFTYVGKLKILRVKAIDWDLNIVSAKLNIENVHLWELIKSDWDYLGQWTGLNRSY